MNPIVHGIINIVWCSFNAAWAYMLARDPYLGRVARGAMWVLCATMVVAVVVSIVLTLGAL